MNRAERRAGAHRRAPQLFHAWSVDHFRFPDGSPAVVLGIGNDDARPSAGLGFDCVCQLDGLIEDLQAVRLVLAGSGCDDAPGEGPSNSPSAIKK